MRIQTCYHRVRACHHHISAPRRVRTSPLLRMRIRRRGRARSVTESWVGGGRETAESEGSEDEVRGSTSEWFSRFYDLLSTCHLHFMSVR